jgi:hypothetical protein
MENDMAKKVTRSRQWTKEELRMIKTLTREKTKMVIARKLKRSVDAMYGLASKLGVILGADRREERDVVSKIEVVPEEERASDSCLHCESMIWFSSTSGGTRRLMLWPIPSSAPPNEHCTVTPV